MPDHESRIGAAREKMRRAGVSGMFLPESADLEYLTGVPRTTHTVDVAWDPELGVEGCFIGERDGPVFLFTHSEWSLPAAPSSSEYETLHMPPRDDAVEWLARGASAAGIGDTLAVGDRTPMYQMELLSRALPEVTTTRASELILELRLRKDADEIDAIRASCDIAVAALIETASRFGSAFSRRDFLVELEHQLVTGGSEPLAYAPDMYAVGPSTSVVWSANVVADGAAMITAPAAVSVDYGAVVRGYRSDIGRTLYVGEPPSGQLEALASVRRAQEAALAALRPGAIAEDVDAAARDLMESDGLGAAFWIPAGHGIGLEIHERPRLAAGVHDEIPEGATLAVEIAAWIEGRTSAFWEDEVVVEADGPVRLSEGITEPLFLG